MPTDLDLTEEYGEPTVARLHNGPQFIVTLHPYDGRLSASFRWDEAHCSLECAAAEGIIYIPGEGDCHIPFAIQDWLNGPEVDTWLVANNYR